MKEMLNKINRYNFNLIAFIVLFVVVITFSLLQMFFVLEEKKHDALVINLAGRQRMLIQKYVKDFFYYIATDNIEPVQETINIYESTHSALIRGGLVPIHNDSSKFVNLEKTNNHEIVSVLNSIEIKWNQLKILTGKMIDVADESKRPYKLIVDESNLIVAEMNTAVSLFQKFSEKKLEKLKIYQFVTSFIVLVLFIICAFLLYKTGIINLNLETIVRKRTKDVIKSNEELKIQIANRKKMEKEKNEVQKQVFLSSKLASIGELAAGVAHEINNPLAIILGNIEFIQNSSAANDPTTAGQIERVIKSVDRISGIVNGLRTYARSDTDHIEVLDLHRLINDTVLLISSIYKNENITINIQLGSKNNIILGNIGKLQQVVMNLISNARDSFNGEQGSIDIETSNISDSSNNEKRILLKITDSGSGISKENVEKIFNAFFTTKDPGKGTGLGLSISHSIVTSLGGEIQVDSELGRGTTFSLSFKSIDKEKTLDTSIKSKEKVVEFKMIDGKALIVDDEQEIREILKNYLESFGLEVTLAQDGDIALENLKKQRFDFLITDLKMPSMGGEELLKKTKELGITNTKLIIITGGIITEYTKKQRAMLKNIADSYIKKPFSKEDIYYSLI